MCVGALVSVNTNFGVEFNFCFVLLPSAALFLGLRKVTYYPGTIPIPNFPGSFWASGVPRSICMREQGGYVGHQSSKRGVWALCPVVRVCRDARDL